MRGIYRPTMVLYSATGETGSDCNAWFDHGLEQSSHAASSNAAMENCCPSHGLQTDGPFSNKNAMALLFMRHNDDPREARNTSAFVCTRRKDLHHINHPERKLRVAVLLSTSYEKYHSAQIAHLTWRSDNFRHSVNWWRNDRRAILIV